jgi:hypothetical protein
MAYDQNAQTWTSTQLLADVRRKASLPTTSTDFTDAVLYRECTDVLWSFAGWALSQGGEGRFLSTLERPISAALTSAYRPGSEIQLPPLAIADTLDNVTWLDSTGQLQARLARIESAIESDVDTPGRSGNPTAYALFDGRIRLYPQPTTGGIVRLTYQRRHPELVPGDAANMASVIGLTGTATATALSVAANTLPAVVGDEVDIFSGMHPYRFAAAGATITALPASTFTVGVPISHFNGLPTSGLRITRAGTSPFVHFPLELRASVTEKVTANLLRILGDLQGSQAAELAAKEELSRVMQMISPRAKRDKPKAVNPHSHMRSGIFRGRW